MIFIQEGSIHGKSHKHQTCFGFELININKGLMNHSVDSVKNAVTWHQQFFNALTNSSIDLNVVCKFKKSDASLKNGNNSKIRIAILFYINANSVEKATADARQLRNDVMVIFQTNNNYINNVYLFAAIGNEKHLADFNDIPANTKIYDYKRKPIAFSHNQIALGYTAQKKRTKKIEFIPQFFTPDLHALDSLAKRIDCSPVFMAVSLILRPVQLKEEQITSLQNVSKIHPINDNQLSETEKEIYYNHLKLIFKKNANLFLFHVQLHMPGFETPGQALHNNIAECFFGNFENLEVVNTKEQKRFHNTQLKKTQQVTPYLYPYEIVKNCFRLPVINGESITWFSNQSDVFNYYPPDMSEDGVLMGIKNKYHQQKEIRITREELAQHVYILGQTGVGKTTLLKSMIMDQIKGGDGVCVVDPHGDLISVIYNQIPFERLSDVVFFDPTTTKDIKINILEWHPKFTEQRTFIFNELIKLIDEIYDLHSKGGPMFEQYFKNALLMVMEVRGTLEDFHRFFFDKSYRKQLMEFSKLKASVDFFKLTQELLGENSFESWASYITSKVNRFVQDDFIAPIINQKHSNINFRHIIDNRKILLIRLPKGRLGNNGVKFIGTLLFNRIIMASFTRENIDPAKRVPFYMYIDEFQNFATQDIETALSESRKYGLRMVLANQTLSQLPENMVKTLLGNVGSQVFFRPGPFDIEVIAPYFKHDISERELLNLENFHALTRLMNKNKPVRPFIMETVCGEE